MREEQIFSRRVFLAGAIATGTQLFLAGCATNAAGSTETQGTADNFQNYLAAQLQAQSMGQPQFSITGIRNINRGELRVQDVYLIEGNGFGTFRPKKEALSLQKINGFVDIAKGSYSSDMFVNMPVTFWVVGPQALDESEKEYGLVVNGGVSELTTGVLSFKLASKRSFVTSNDLSIQPENLMAILVPPSSIANMQQRRFFSLRS